MRITIKDIAREANMSASAVSLVLNNKPCRIAEEKKERIRQIARQLQYAPNQAARSLVTKKTQMLALILPDIENTFFSSLAKQIEDNCRRDGYFLIIANSNDTNREDLKLLRSIVARDVDGLFFIISNESCRDSTALVKELESMTIPYVLVDRPCDGISCDKVLFDNQNGGYLAVRHLLDMGHTRIGCVANTAASNGIARLHGYQSALDEAGLAFNSTYVIEGDYHFDSGVHAAQELLRTDVTAAFVSNDMMAFGFLQYLYGQGLQVPSDFSLIGYDNSLSPFVPSVGLSSVAQDVRKLGEDACRLMMEQLHGVVQAPRTICLTPRLVVRSSVRQV